MKKNFIPLILFTAVFLLNSLLGIQPDFKNPALTPVAFQPTPKHDTLELIDGGRLNFCLVGDFSNRKNQKSALRGARLLQDSIRQCTGISPEVYNLEELSQARKLPYTIILGYNSLSKQLGAAPFQGPRQGYQIFTWAKGVVIAGYDSEILPEKTRKAPLDHTGVLRGTLWGACDFAERILGCRWYFPGEYGSLYPKLQELQLPPVSYSDYPRFYNRDGCWIGWSLRYGQKKWEALLGKYHPKTQSPDPEFRIQERWRLENFMGPKQFHPGHDPEPSRIMKFYADRKKDIFFTNESGYMYYNAKAHIGNDFDLTNLKFADILIDAMKKYYASNGKDYNIWSYSPNSSYINFGQCDGEVKLADMLRNPVVRELNLITQKNLDRGSEFSEIYGRFLQYYANRVKKEFPGLRVAFMPYQGGTYAPIDPRWKLPDNIDLRVCTHAFPRYPRNPKKIAKTMQCLKEWYEATGNRPIDSLWFYHIPAQGGSPMLRAIAAQFVGESIRVCGKYLGRTNIFFDQYGGLDWSYYYSEYCGARAFWNPDFNADAAIDEHWEPFYGEKAGRELRKFHAVLKDAYIRHYMMNDNENSINPLYPPLVIDQLEKHLKQAAACISPGTVEEKRFRLFSYNWKDAIQSQRNRQNYILPSYSVYRMTGQDQVVLDGRNTEKFWSAIKAIPLIDPLGSGRILTGTAEIRLAWNDQGIYGLMEAPYAPYASADRDVWHNDSCEIFFSADAKMFYHYTVDAMNNGADGNCRKLPIATPYNGQWQSPGFRHAVHRTARNWSMEFFVPFQDMGEKTPAPYSCWNINIVSNKLGNPPHYVSSAMTLGNNHNIEMFGLMKFLGKGDVQ